MPARNKNTQPAPTPPILNLEEMAHHLENNQQEVSSLEFQTTMVNSMLEFGKVIKGLEGVNDKLANHEDRLEALEKKLGDQSDFPIPLTIVMQNLPPSNDVSEETVARDVIENLQIEGVSGADVTRVKRKGFKLTNGSQRGRPGTLMVELSSKEAKLKVLRAKKSLAQHQSEDMKMIRIDSMKTPEQLNQEHFNRTLLKMTPGGEQYFIAGSGALRPQTRPAEAGRFQGPPPPRTYARAATPHQALPSSQQWRPTQPAIPGLHPAPPPRPLFNQQQTPLLRPPVLVHPAEQQRQRGDYHTPDFIR